MKNNLLKVFKLPGLLSLFLLGLSALNAQVPFNQSIDSCLLLINKKVDPTVTLVYKDTMSFPSFTEFNMPVKMKTGNEIAAMSLGFYFPEEYLEITGMEFANGAQGFSFNITDSLFSIAWSDVNPIIINDEGTIITLNMKSLDLAGLAGTIKLRIYELSEFADQFANIIEGVVLEIPEIEYLVPDTNEFLTGIYPNPFDEYISINFHLETESKVKISLFSLIGLEINQVADATYPAGPNQVKLYALYLSKGLYLLKFEIRNSEGSKTKLIKIISIG